MRRRAVSTWLRWLAIGVIAGSLVPGAALAGSSNLDDPFTFVGKPGQAIVPTGQKLARDLTASLATMADTDTAKVIVQTAADPNAGALTALRTATGGFTPKYVWSEVVNGFAATLTKAQILTLAVRPEVVQIEPDRPVYPMLETSTRYTGVQAARLATGLTGRGVTVAVIDSGIDASHVDLQGKVVAWHDTSGEDTTSPTDGSGHGTHVAGIIAGAGKGDARYTGVAPGASLVGVKVFHSASPVTDSSNTVEAVEWVARHQRTYDIAIANMSLGSIDPCVDGGSISTQAVDNAYSKKGIVFVVAAGNTGPGPCTVSSPGDAKHAISVGNGIDPGPATSSKRGWALAISSARGPTFDARIKPDVVAPGTAIMAPNVGSGNGYVAKSGTSMASPFVAGIAALIKERNPGWGPDRIKQQITRTATPWGVGRPNNEYGWGMVNAPAALNAGTFDGFGIRHEVTQGALSGIGASRTHSFTVTDATTPLALTLVITDWRATVYDSVNGVRVSQGSPNLDIELYDPSGALVSMSPCTDPTKCAVPIVPPVANTERQEQIRYLPRVTGTHTLKVISRDGGGTYILDASYE
ncbi:MAG TPA: S8 family serine peptidase [Chloroflexota bacterium]|nr:S8 family serine peptidase [Chloroflexota bacterium]